MIIFLTCARVAVASPLRAVHVEEKEMARWAGPKRAISRTANDYWTSAVASALASTVTFSMAFSSCAMTAMMAA